MHIVNRSSAWVRRGAAASIVAAIALGAMPGVALASDIDGHWGEASLQQWVGYGVLQGYGNGNYGPNDHITRAELVTLLDRVMEYQNSATNTFEDLDDNWYTETVLKGVAAGIITGDQNGTDLIRPNDHLTREEAAAIFARVMGLDTASAPSAGFVDQNKIADWATGSVNAMKAAGYVNGFEGCFNPTDNLTRAEAITILDNIFSDLYQSAGEFTGEVEGSAVISSGDVTLKDAVVDGDLVIAEGVADGHVVLDNVTVKGKLIVRGGGVNSVIIKGGSQISQVRVARQGAAVRLAVEGSSQVGTVVVDNGADTVRVEGAVEIVSVQGASASVEVTGTVGSLAIADTAVNAKVTVIANATVAAAETSASGAQLVVSGSVESVAVKGEGTVVTAESGATISKVTTEAANTKVEGAGTVGSVVAGEGSEGTVVDTSGTKVENAGSGSVSAGGETVAPGGSVTTPDSSTGGNGSGSTGGSGSGSGGGSTVVTTASVSTLAELKSALESDTITTVNVTGSITADDAIAVNKTVNVQSGATLNVMGKKLSGTGTVVVQSGGTLKIDANYNGGGDGSLLPSIKTIEVKPGGTLASQTTTADPTDVVFVGAGSDARIKTGESTTVTLGFADAYATGEGSATRPTVTISGNASVPTGQTWYTMFDSGEEAIGIDMTVASGTLTVNGNLKAVSANSTGSTLTIAKDASLVVAANGKLKIAKKAVVTVSGTATSEGTITGTGSFTAPGFVKDGDAWVKKFAAGLGTAESPYQISSLDEWKNISVVATEGLNFLLTDNLTLDSTESMLSSFSGTLDGGNHSITLPQNPANADEWCAFAERATGTIRNLIINHGSGEVIPFIGYASGASMTFENVDICTPDGNVTCQMSTSDNNESAYMAHSNALKLTFKDCNNYLSYYNSGGANAYTSAFMGGYTTTSEPTTITFDNCWNYGDLLMSHASLFVGNGSQMDNDTIVVTNSGNYGSIIGYSSAQPFAAISTSSLNNYVALNAAEYNKNSGEIKVMPKLEGFTLTLGEDSKIVIGTPSEASGVDHYNLTYSAYGRVDEGIGEGTYLFNVVFRVSAAGATEHSKYAMVDVATAERLGISVESLEFKSTGSYDMEYAVSEGYLICDFGSYAPTSVVLNNANPTISATAVSADGDILGFAKLGN